MDNSGTHLWLVMMKASAAVQSYAERSIQSLGMCYSDFGVLECLLHKGDTPINAIGAKLGLTSGSITTSIDRLESKGLVQRTASATDRRSKLVALTKAGRKLIVSEFEKHQRDMDSLGEHLSVKEREQLVGLLRKYGLAAAEKHSQSHNHGDAS